MIANTKSRPAVKETSGKRNQKGRPYIKPDLVILNGDTSEGKFTNTNENTRVAGRGTAFGPS